MCSSDLLLLQLLRLKYPSGAQLHQILLQPWEKLSQKACHLQRQPQGVSFYDILKALLVRGAIASIAMAQEGGFELEMSGEKVLRTRFENYRSFLSSALEFDRIKSNGVDVKDTDNERALDEDIEGGFVKAIFGCLEVLGFEALSALFSTMMRASFSPTSTDATSLTQFAAQHHLEQWAVAESILFISLSGSSLHSSTDESKLNIITTFISLTHHMPSPLAAKNHSTGFAVAQRTVMDVFRSGAAALAMYTLTGV